MSLFDQNPFKNFKEQFTFSGPTQESPMTDGFILPGVTSGAELAKPNTIERRQPSSTNYLFQTYFRFNIPQFTDVNYFCQRVTLPGFGAVGSQSIPTRFSDIKVPNHKVSFDDLQITFLVDENMANWRQIQEWMKTIYLVRDFKNYEKNTKDHYKDADLMILNSAMNSKLHVRFNQIFPVSLSGLDFDSSVTDFTPFTATATFAYDTYEFVNPTSGFSP